mmetsp:Transcript_57854/g.167821  ORF Transcript_57854/g.167821 Transcript_57854/m.167821 type:complete len:401 (-) Transcript_57854:1181-2383(-)
MARGTCGIGPPGVPEENAHDVLRVRASPRIVDGPPAPVVSELDAGTGPSLEEKRHRRRTALPSRQVQRREVVGPGDVLPAHLQHIGDCSPQHPLGAQRVCRSLGLLGGLPRQRHVGPAASGRRLRALDAHIVKEIPDGLSRLAAAALHRMVQGGEAELVACGEVPRPAGVHEPPHRLDDAGLRSLVHGGEAPGPLHGGGPLVEDLLEAPAEPRRKAPHGNETLPQALGILIREALNLRDEALLLEVALQLPELRYHLAVPRTPRIVQGGLPGIVRRTRARRKRQHHVGHTRVRAVLGDVVQQGVPPLELHPLPTADKQVLHQITHDTVGHLDEGHQLGQRLVFGQQLSLHLCVHLHEHLVSSLALGQFLGDAHRPRAVQSGRQDDTHAHESASEQRQASA